MNTNPFIVDYMNYLRETVSSRKFTDTIIHNYNVTSSSEKKNADFEG